MPNDTDSANFRYTADKTVYIVSRAKRILTREQVASCLRVKIRLSALDTKNTILSAVHRKLALSVSFCARKVDFTHTSAVKF